MLPLILAKTGRLKKCSLHDHRRAHWLPRKDAAWLRPPSTAFPAGNSMMFTDQALCTQNLQLTAAPLPPGTVSGPTPRMCPPALHLALPFPVPQRFTEGSLPEGSCRKSASSGCAVKRPAFERTSKVQKATLSLLHWGVCTCNREAPPGRRGDLQNQNTSLLTLSL